MAENVGNHPNSFFTSALAYEKATKKAEQQKEQRAAAANQTVAAPTNGAGEANGEGAEEPAQTTEKDVAMQDETPAVAG